MKKQKTLQFSLSLPLIFSVATMIFLLLSPSQSKNFIIFRYSLIRLGMLALVASVSLLFLWVLWNAFRDDLWLKRFSDSFQSNKIFIPTIFVAGLGILITFNFFTLPAYKVAKNLIQNYYFIYFRLVPLMLWVGSVSVSVMFTLLILRHSSEETHKLSKHYLRQSIYISAGIFFILGYLISIYWGWLGTSN